jgi:iron complex outermembrane recepter protein
VKFQKSEGGHKTAARSRVIKKKRIKRGGLSMSIVADNGHLPARSHCISKFVLVSAISALLAPSLAGAQDQAPPDVQPPSDDVETIVVSGIRQTIQSSIAAKREEELIVEALVAEEIGDLPALSIGEALETLTSAASHREQGGATEISIRGLGPFLGSSVINGRAASNGSGDRSVNFSQFPSELFNKLAVFKTQSASLIEGGVSGQIALDTVKPLAFGKQRLQGEIKGSYNPDNHDIDSDQRFRDVGYRGAISYVDQFRLGESQLGISLGYSHNRSTNPEQEANVSNTLVYCKYDPADVSVGVFDDQNCDSPRPDAAGAEDFVIAQNSYTYRQNITDDERDAFFGAIQLQPSDSIDINADVQYSKRLFRERRNDLNFSEGRRIDHANAPLATRLNYDLITGPNGELLQFTGEGSVETLSEYLERDEEYLGTGINVEFQASERLKLSADASYSRTKREEAGLQVRMRMRDQLDILGNPAGYPRARESDWTSGNSNTSDDRIEYALLMRQNGSEVFNFVVQQFDVNNHDLYRDNARLRNDLEQDRYNSISAGRIDVEYDLEGFFSSVQGGIRYQELKYRDVPGAAVGTSRFEHIYSNDALAGANQACRTSFPESGFLSSVSGGNPLVTNIDAAGNVISTTNSFATFDALCLARVLEATEPSGNLAFDSDGVPIPPSGNFDSIQNSDLIEDTWAAYIQANFDGEIGTLPVRGNFGVRVVRSEVLSKSFRGDLNAVFDGTTGELLAVVEETNSLTRVSAGDSYTEVLPSFNVTAELRPDLLARFSVFRALSRPDPASLAFGRTFSTLVEGDTPIFSIADALGTANATGNPFMSPLMSWNLDAAIEWYPDPDSIFAVGAYYKEFNGGFETVGRFETFTVDGQDLQTLVTTVDAADETSTIYGFELSAAHRFSYLPRPLDSLGFKLSYNYADSDFEFQDDTLGAIATVNEDGSVTYSEALIPPADIFGLSNHVFSAQLFYEIGGFEFQGVYKYRSQYFQQFVDTPGRVRYTDDTGVVEARLSYSLNKNVRFTVEGLNLFSEPRTDYRGTVDNLGAVLAYGPRYYAGVRVMF